MNNDAPADLFFNNFATLLDLNAPEIKVIPCYDDFFNHLVFQIEKYPLLNQGSAKKIKVSRPVSG